MRERNASVESVGAAAVGAVGEGVDFADVGGGAGRGGFRGVETVCAIAGFSAGFEFCAVRVEGLDVARGCAQQGEFEFGGGEGEEVLEGRWWEWMFEHAGGGRYEELLVGWGDLECRGD